MKPELTNEQVAAFLRNNDDFFSQRTDLLELLRLPDPKGNAVSLLERQAQVLRERNNKLRQRLDELLSVANENDLLFGKTRRLVLELLDAPSLTALLNALIAGLKREFSPDSISLILYRPFNVPERQKPYCYHLARNDLHDALQVMLGNNRAICGIFRATELEQLFPQQHEKIRSAAMVPLFHQQHLGLLAIGSEDANHFKSSLGTLFINHIGEVLSRRLADFSSLSKSRSASGNSA